MILVSVLYFLYPFIIPQPDGKKLYSGLTDGRLSFPAILHMYKHKDDDIGGVVTEFAHLKATHLALCL